MDFRLGIDTGGTYTDAVLTVDDNRIIATAKRLTTRQDLTVGIANVLGALPAEKLGQVSLVAPFNHPVDQFCGGGKGGAGCGSPAGLPATTGEQERLAGHL